MKLRHITLTAAAALVMLAACSKDQNTAASDPGREVNAKAGVMGAMLPGIHGPGPAGILAALDLTEEQKGKIADILASDRPEDCDGKARPGKKRHHKGQGRPGKAPECQGDRTGIHQKIMAVLTPAQQAKFKELKARLDAGEMPEELVDARVAHMTEILDLTADQQAELKTLFLKTGTEMLALKNKEGKRRGQFRKLRETHETAMLAILTEEQQETWQEMRQRRRQHARKAFKRMQGKHRAMRLDRLTELLNLTDDQQKAVKKTLQDSRKEMKDMLKDAEDREEMRQAMHEHRQEVNREIMALLTPEQQEAFKKHLAENRQKK